MYYLEIIYIYIYTNIKSSWKRDKVINNWWLPPIVDEETQLQSFKLSPVHIVDRGTSSIRISFSMICVSQWALPCLTGRVGENIILKLEGLRKFNERKRRKRKIKQKPSKNGTMDLELRHRRTWVFGFCGGNRLCVNELCDRWEREVNSLLNQEWC